MPGNAIDILMQDLTAQGVSPDDARNQAAALMGIDPDQPLPGQYLDYLNNVIHGDFGHSYRSAGLSGNQDDHHGIAMDIVQRRFVIVDHLRIGYRSGVHHGL